MTVGNKPIDFLVDTGATYSVLNTKLTGKSSNEVTVTGVSGQVQKQTFLQPLECQLGGQKLTHSFLYMPDCPIPLLGRDLLCKLHAQITFSPKRKQLCVEVPLENALQLQAFLACPGGPGVEPFPPEICEQVDQTAWADGTPGKAVNVQPIKIYLKEGARVPRKKQYPLKKEALEGIQPVLQKFLKSGLIRPCRSPYNTLILPVKKPHSDEYRFVQDLRASMTLSRPFTPRCLTLTHC